MSGKRGLIFLEESRLYSIRMLVLIFASLSFIFVLCFAFEQFKDLGRRDRAASERGEAEKSKKQRYRAKDDIVYFERSDKRYESEDSSRKGVVLEVLPSKHFLKKRGYRKFRFRFFQIG